MSDAAPSHSTRAHRVRAIATALVVVAAVLSTVATSQSQPMIEDEAGGTSLVLDEEHSVVTVGFAAAASDATTTADGRIGWEIRPQPFWRDVPTNDQRLRVSARRVAGRGYLSLRDLVCSGDGCLGDFELTFRLPRRLDEGSVHVAWRVRAWAQFDDRNEPPDGARIDVKIAMPVGSAVPPDRIWTSQVSVSYEEPVIVWDVEVRRQRGLSDGSLLVEAGPGRYPYSLESLPPGEPALISVAMVPASGPAIRLGVSSSTPIPISRRCEDGPCAISVRFVVQLVPPIPYGVDPTLDLTIVGPPGEPLDVHAVRVNAPVIETTYHLDALHLAGTQQGSSQVAIRIPARSLRRESFYGTDPLVWAELALGTDQFAVDRLAENGIETTFGFPDPDSAYTWGRTPDFGMNEPMIIVIPNDCKPGRACRVPLGISFRLSQSLDEGEGVTLRPALRVFLAYPETSIVPPDAAMTVEEIGTPSA